MRDVPRNPMARCGSDVKNRRTHEVKLSDGIITLSPLCLDDAEAHLAGEDEMLVRWLSGGPGTREGVETYTRRCRDQWDAAGPLRAFGIRVGTENTLAGTIDLRFVAEDLSPGQVNVAYGLYPSWRGRCLATRAVLLASRYAASEDGTRLDWLSGTCESDSVLRTALVPPSRRDGVLSPFGRASGTAP
ncbi:GNAT family N-acetyltransferase [Streptomyces tuirus]